MLKSTLSRAAATAQGGSLPVICRFVEDRRLRVGMSKPRAQGGGLPHRIRVIRPPKLSLINLSLTPVPLTTSLSYRDPVCFRISVVLRSSALFPELSRFVSKPECQLQHFPSVSSPHSSAHHW